MLYAAGTLSRVLKHLAAPIPTERVMLSSGGVSLTDLRDPTQTVTAAVNKMFRFAGTVITAGATATNARHKCDQGHGGSDRFCAFSEVDMTFMLEAHGRWKCTTQFEVTLLEPYAAFASAPRSSYAH